MSADSRVCEELLASKSRPTQDRTRPVVVLDHLRAGVLVGLVTYEIAYGSRRETVTHRIPARPL